MHVKSITPHLVIRGASDAIEFYKKGFGAVEVTRMPAQDGKRLWHAQLMIGDAPLMIADEFDEMPGNHAKSPAALNGSGVVMHLAVDNCDAVFQRAVEAGSTVVIPPMDMFWGDRYAQLVDPFGHRWAIAHTNENLSFDQMRERGEAFAKANQPSCE